MSSDASNNDSFEDSDEYRRGQKGERLVEVFIQRCDWMTMPARKFTGEGAPTLQRLHEHTVLPDVLAVHDGTSRFVEVKTKTVPFEMRKTGEVFHGIGFKSWQAYRDAKRETGLDVWLFIYEIESGTLLRAEIDDLGQIDDMVLEGDAGYDDYGEEMAFWHRDKFEGVTADIEAGDCRFGQQKLDSGAGDAPDGAFGGGGGGEQERSTLDKFAEEWADE